MIPRTAFSGDAGLLAYFSVFCHFYRFGRYEAKQDKTIHIQQNVIVQSLVCEELQWCVRAARTQHDDDRCWHRFDILRFWLGILTPNYFLVVVM